jgi:hypothetical protein
VSACARTEVVAQAEGAIQAEVAAQAKFVDRPDRPVVGWVELSG